MTDRLGHGILLSAGARLRVWGREIRRQRISIDIHSPGPWPKLRVIAFWSVIDPCTAETPPGLRRLSGWGPCRTGRSRRLRGGHQICRPQSNETYDLSRLRSDDFLHLFGLKAHHNIDPVRKQRTMHDAGVFQDEFARELGSHRFGIHVHLSKSVTLLVHQIADLQVRQRGEVSQFLYIQGYFKNVAVVIFHIVLRKPRFRFLTGRSCGEAVKSKSHRCLLSLLQFRLGTGNAVHLLWCG